MLQFIIDFMKIWTLRMSVGSTLSDERRIENGVVQRAVLGVTLFIVAMAGNTDGIEESIKIIAYADDWMVHTTHQHQRVATIQIQ
jgi:hypothetical protein